MFKTLTIAIIVLVVGSTSPVNGEPLASLKYGFDDPAELEAWVVQATGEAGKRMPTPKIQRGQLYLLESWWKSTAAAAHAAPTEALHSTVDMSFQLVMNTGTEGASLIWLDVGEHGVDAALPELEQWEAPSLPRAFGVGFDASNPPNRDPFRGSGNVYDRPQHEVSLHWDGMEIVKRTTPMDFRDEEPHTVRVLVQYVPGGADVSLWIDDEAIYDQYFIASMTPFAGRPVFAARNTENAGDILIDDLSITCDGAIEAPESPLHIVAIDHQLNDKDHPRNEAVVQFPDDTDRFARIVCTLRLDKPETRFDPWDRLAGINILGDDDEKFELIRYITPYHRGHVWKVDVTDFRPLLRGERTIEQVCTTYGEGWVVTVTFDFYPGETDRLASDVINLWSGGPEIGNPEKPVEDFYVAKSIDVGDAAFAKVRTVVTGHGMAPNTNNAAEFMPIGRTLIVNGERFTNQLWKTDNYLNPCRPQGGTWKYDRAGWAPGDVVAPWAVDVSHLLNGGALEIDYDLDPFINEARGKTWAPTHRTESHLILYRKVGAGSSQ